MKKIKSVMGFWLIALAFGVVVLGGAQSARAQSDKDAGCGKKDQKLSPEERASVKITIEQARATALARVSGTVIDEELEKENGRLQYAFDIRTSEGKVFDVEVDAQSGDVLKAVEDKDTDDKDDDDDDD
jgi:uncharacterized membrane protein YkoI